MTGRSRSSARGRQPGDSDFRRLANPNPCFCAVSANVACASPREELSSSAREGQRPGAFGPISSCGLKDYSRRAADNNQPALRRPAHRSDRDRWPSGKSSAAARILHPFASHSKRPRTVQLVRLRIHAPDALPDYAARPPSAADGGLGQSQRRLVRAPAGSQDRKAARRGPRSHPPIAPRHPRCG